MPYSGSENEVLNESQHLVWPESRRGQSSGLCRKTAICSQDEAIIDSSLVRMIEALPPGHDFPSRIDHFCEQSDAHLRTLRTALSLSNKDMIEELCREISQQAITVGASRVLRIAYEVQAVGRSGVLTEAENLINDLDQALADTQTTLKAFL